MLTLFILQQPGGSFPWFFICRFGLDVWYLVRSVNLDHLPPEVAGADLVSAHSCRGNHKGLPRPPAPAGATTRDCLYREKYCCSERAYGRLNHRTGRVGDRCTMPLVSSPSGLRCSGAPVRFSQVRDRWSQDC